MLYPKPSWVSGNAQCAATSSMRCSNEGLVRSSSAAQIALLALRCPPPVSEIRKSARFAIISPLGAHRYPFRSPTSRRRVADAAASRGEKADERSSRSIVEAKDVAELDLGVSVVAVMILGKHDLQGAEDRLDPARALPAELGGVAPPDVQLAEEEAEEGPFPREPGGERCDDEVGDRPEKAVEQNRRVTREDGVIPIGTTAIVVGAQMQREPKVLRNVIEEGRAEITDNEDDE